MRELMAKVGLAIPLSELGLTRHALDVIMEGGIYAGRAGNNPKPVSKTDARAMPSSIFLP